MAKNSLSLRLGLVQLKVSVNKEENIANAKHLISEAAQNGAGLITLPECFNSPYGTQYFADYAESIPGETTKLLSGIAKELQIHLVGGSIPESCDGKLYNTAAVFGPDGAMLGTFRKIHLADVDVKGKLTFTESDIISPGNKPFTFEIGPWKFGIGICYDLRFPELATWYYKQGCNVLLYPGLFNKTTGPVHWQSLLKARAMDNQVYVAGCSQSPEEAVFYVPWGHSAVIDPWGNVIATTGEKEDIVYADLDLSYVETVRKQIPIHHQKRTDIYSI